jgi:nucleoside-diphosphate-sugar epimerase
MTGATGYIGGAVATELRRHGHGVTALVRPASEGRHLRDLEVHAGALESLPGLGSLFRATEGLFSSAEDGGPGVSSAGVPCADCVDGGFLRYANIERCQVHRA